MNGLDKELFMNQNWMKAGFDNNYFIHLNNNVNRVFIA